MGRLGFAPVEISRPIGILSRENVPLLRTAPRNIPHKACLLLRTILPPTPFFFPRAPFFAISAKAARSPPPSYPSYPAYLDDDVLNFETRRDETKAK